MFSVNTIEEVILFEKRLNDYMKKEYGSFSSHISLENTYNNCNLIENGKKVFACVFDLQINFAMLRCDIWEIGATWNKIFSEGGFDGGSILDNSLKFNGKMDIHRRMNSYVLKYRAMWDKLMGLIILVYVPEEYESFIKADKKKKKFQKIAEKSLASNMGISKIVQFIKTELQKFDDKFRTPEAHNTGSLRKFSLSMEPMAESPALELVDYWNNINDMLSKIENLLFDAKQK